MHLHVHTDSTTLFATEILRLHQGVQHNPGVVRQLQGGGSWRLQQPWTALNIIEPYLSLTAFIPRSQCSFACSLCRTMYMYFSLQIPYYISNLQEPVRSLCEWVAAWATYRRTRVFSRS